MLGLIAVHRAHPALSGISLTEALTAAAAAQPVEVAARVPADAGEFLARRLEQVLVEEGHPVDRVRAVLPHAGRPSFADLLLAQLGRLSAEPEFLALAEAIQRARRIVPDGTAAAYDPALLKEPAEVTLHEAVRAVRAEPAPAD